MLRIAKLIFAITLGCLMTGPIFAQSSEQTTTSRDRQAVNITVYNSNLGLVRETRRLTLPDGRIALRFADVTAQIRPETVHLASLLSPTALRILEQNYQYDLLNPAKLLDKFVGKEITLVLRRYQNNSEIFEPVQATLLSNNAGQVWRINGQIVINPTNIVEIRFPDVQEFGRHTDAGLGPRKPRSRNANRRSELPDERNELESRLCFGRQCGRHERRFAGL